MIVVIPSNRSINLYYLAPLIDANARFVIVDDTPGSIRINHPQFQIYNWQDRKKMLGKLDPYFARLNGACRNFGFFVAWHQSEQDEIIIALDDDCKVNQPNFPQNVVKYLQHTERQTWKGKGRHFNILDLYTEQNHNLFPRGFPYQVRCDYKKWTSDKESKTDATLNLGLWQGVFDINGIDKISQSNINFANAAYCA